MKPSIGRIVLVPVDPTINNGCDVAVGIITRVWTDEMVNVRVVLDGPGGDWKTSVSLCADEETARAKGHAVYWPPRV